MICLRCGWCCIGFMIAVPCKDEHGTYQIIVKPDGYQCPNLEFSGDTASCKIHNEPWYNKTACFKYQNSNEDPDFICKRGKPCILGPFHRDKIKDIHAAQKLSIADCEIIEPMKLIE